MKGLFRYPYCLIFLLLLAASVTSPAKAQQGQYSLSYAPFKFPGMSSQGGLVTYGPVKLVDGESLQLRGDDGHVFTFTLGAATIYCHGDKRVPDWTYLKQLKKNISVTVMTNSDADNAARVIWDQGPTISTADGQFDFSLPPLCK
jgi:hypothetical protein